MVGPGRATAEIAWMSFFHLSVGAASIGPGQYASDVRPVDEGGRPIGEPGVVDDGVDVLGPEHFGQC